MDVNMNLFLIRLLDFTVFSLNRTLYVNFLSCEVLSFKSQSHFSILSLPGIHWIGSWVSRVVFLFPMDDSLTSFGKWHFVCISWMHSCIDIHLGAFLLHYFNQGPTLTSCYKPLLLFGYLGAACFVKIPISPSKYKWKYPEGKYHSAENTAYNDSG
jgi:hypothetical protein